MPSSPLDGGLTLAEMRCLTGVGAQKEACKGEWCDGLERKLSGGSKVAGAWIWSVCRPDSGLHSQVEIRGSGRLIEPVVSLCPALCPALCPR